MPSVTNTEVFGLERAIRTAKYPKSVDIESLNSELTPGIQNCASCPTGEGHDNFLKGIIVQMDLTLSQNAWMEAERYHWLDFVSSQSKMHKLPQFDLKKQCNKYVDPRIIEIEQEHIDRYNHMIRTNQLKRGYYSRGEVEEARLTMLYNCPMGFELTAGMTTNYLQLKTIYQQRKTHALPDWHEVIAWIESLPRFLELTQKE